MVSIKVFFLGSFIGLIPGIGGSCIDWISYSHAKTSVKNNEDFGKGDIRGVIGPESSSNSKEGGALIPTLLFAIPGSGGTAVLMGGLILLGVEPGIQLINNRLDLVYTIIWSLAIANIFGALICVYLAKPISSLTTINFTILAPFLISLILFAIYNSSRSWGDLAFAMLIGLIAVYMKRFEYSRVALMIGFVLSDGIETNLYQTIQFYTVEELFLRPVFLVLIAICVLSILSGLKIIDKAKKLSQTAKVIEYTRKPQLYFAILMSFIAVYTIWATKDLAFLGKIYPQGVGAVMLICSLGLIYQIKFAKSGSVVLHDSEANMANKDDIQPFWMPIFWFLLPLLVAIFIGFYVAIGLFVFWFLKKIANIKTSLCFVSSISIWVILAIISHFMVMDFAPGIIQKFIELPWPIN